MARLHSGKHGKSGTKRAKAEPTLLKVEVNEKEIKSIILRLSKEGTSASKIGILLRDRYAVSDVKSLLGVSLSKFLKEQNALPEYPEDLFSLMKKAYIVRNHLKSFKKDIHNKVKLMHIESKINRLVKYYNSRKRLPDDWRYDPEKVALIVK